MHSDNTPIALRMSAPVTPRNNWHRDEFIIASFIDPRLTGDTTRDETYIRDWRMEQVASEGGIMVRQCLKPGSPMLYTYCNSAAGDSVEIEYRKVMSAKRIVLTGSLAGKLPMHLRVQRVGTLIRALASADGKNYSELATLVLPTGYQYVGLTATTAATFSGYSLTGVSGAE
jgi:hypothetical protein